MTRRPQAARRRALKRAGSGLSLVEMLVGVTIGLFVLAGAATVATSQLGDHRRLLLDAQLQQDVRLTLDLVTRDLRRAAYWGKSNTAVWPTDWSAALVNPYTLVGVEGLVQGVGTGITFRRSTDEVSGQLITAENNQLDAGEYGGFKYLASDHAVAVLISQGNWQTLTDPSVIKVTKFNVTLTSQNADVPCGVECTGTNKVLGPGGCPLVQTARNATIEISAEAATDSSIKRSLKSDVHLRNDLVQEVCPTP
jgi:hypothetical protein